MLNILLCGANGRMGRAVAQAANENADISISAGIDVVSADIDLGFPVFQSLSDFSGKADVIVDFSHHSAVEGILVYAKENRIPVVIATTGHSPEETNAIKAAACEIPVFWSRNMSLGINLLIGLAQKAVATLGDSFDIEIIEKHHNQKLDAPSGTALMIADAISQTAESQTEYIYDRHNIRRKRSKNEIGIHAVRGGTIVGEHEVIFAGHDEVISLSHSAASREVFACGALRAAKYISAKAPGFYTMSELVNEMI